MDTSLRATHTSSPKVKLNSVQYLRAVAVLLVVAFHAAGNLGSVRPNFNPLEYGQFGVDLFFVISGFIMVVTTASNSSVSNFVAKRLWRIVPLYWLVTFAYVAVLFVAPEVMRSAALDFPYILKSFFFIPSYNPKSVHEIWPVVVPGWSLNYEMYFYAIFAAALFVSARRQYWTAISALLLLLGIGQVIDTNNPIVITYTNTFLLEFVFGIIVGAAFLKESAALTKTLSLCLLATAVTAIICTSVGIVVWRSAVYGSISGAILSLLLSFEQNGIKFSNAYFIAIGDASYSIYLTHPAVIGSLRHLSNAFNFQEVGMPLKLVALVTALGSSILVGWLTFTQFERRIISCRDIFMKWRRAHRLII